LNTTKNKMKAKTMKRREFGIIGYPLGHSFSKAYFERKFAEEKIENVSYKKYPIENINFLPTLLDKECSLCGFNVTIPQRGNYTVFG